MLKLLIKQMLCRHEFRFLRNIYGDEINQYDGKRSIWVCLHCHKSEYRDLFKGEKDNV